ncbi:MAG: hypothetical protein U9Q81_20040 [Pseudomonadota bacterium]|nr:hypothetical protein [Pseudomonadota bacterium]
MNRISRWVFGLLLSAVFFSAQTRADPAVRFFVIGDVPYDEGEVLQLETLLERELEKTLPFIAHVGDVKGGSSPCVDQTLRRIAELFRAQPVPVVYTPGDNEWTDCRKPAAGGYDPMERLERVRRLFYAEPAVLRLNALNAEQPDSDFPENYFFLHNGVLFVAVHVVGSHNNMVPNDVSAMAEFEARSAANRRHLLGAVKTANAVNASALVLLFHANPGLESSTAPRGFGPFREDLAAVLQGYAGPVLAVHGDRHRYKLDNPLKDPSTGEIKTRFTRLEVPGSPVVAGVWVSVNPGERQVFDVEIAYPSAHELLMED